MLDQGVSPFWLGGFPVLYCTFDLVCRSDLGIDFRQLCFKHVLVTTGSDPPGATMRD